MCVFGGQGRQDATSPPPGRVQAIGSQVGEAWGLPRGTLSPCQGWGEGAGRPQTSREVPLAGRLREPLRGAERQSGWTPQSLAGVSLPGKPVDNARK